MHVSVGEAHRAKCWLLISADFPAVTRVTGVAVYNLSVTGFVYLKLEIRLGQDDGRSFGLHNVIACGMMCSGAGDFVLSSGFTSFFVNQEVNMPPVALVCGGPHHEDPVHCVESQRAILVPLLPLHPWDLILAHWGM